MHASSGAQTTDSRAPGERENRKTPRPRLLGLNDVQSGVLDIAFRVADDQGLLLVDLKDLRAMLAFLAEHATEYTTTYGNVSTASVGAIQRALISVEDQGGDLFFGEPEVDLSDWFARDGAGRGYVNVLNAERLIESPAIYAMFLLWMLGDLFEKLPEVGDLDKPKLVFFFDEAHLLFDGMPKELLSRIVQVVKLIRSKGVGVYFVTQSPADIPDEVLAQLSNRVQHGLRAYTPAEARAVRAAAESFRANPRFDTADAIGELGTGEALVSFLDGEGRPSVVERARVLPPQCLMAAADAETIAGAIAAQADLHEKYARAIDRQSAYEDIRGIVAPDAAPSEAPAGTAGAARGVPEEPASPSSTSWTCACGAQNTGKFCTECGATRPHVQGTRWICNCGTVNDGKFCSNCGQPYETGILTKEQKKEAERKAAAQEKAEAKERAEREKLEAMTMTERFKAEQAERKLIERERAADRKALKKAAGSIATPAGRTGANGIVRGILKNLF